MSSQLSDSIDEFELQRRLEGLSRLTEVTQTLAAEVDTDRILEAIVNAACDALDCERASLFLYDDETKELYTSVVTELEISEIRKSIDYGISGWVAREREVANVPDPPSDPRWNSQFDEKTGFRTRNILAAPLLAPHGGGLIGVLQLLNKRDGAFQRYDEDLLRAFSHHAAVALDRARLVEEIRKQKEVETSLQLARRIQRGFMPSQLPAIPGYEVATWWFPNQAVGGDYCDVVPLKNGSTLCCIADVSGHGLGPALLMASVRAALRASLLDYSAPTELLERLAKALAVDLQNGMFITMVLGTLDVANHRWTYANAGHAPALHYQKASDTFRELESTGLPIGVLDDPTYPCGEAAQLAVGDLIVLTTDGIVEAMNEAGEQFGVQRLEKYVRDYCHEAPSVLAGHIGAEVTSYYVGENPADDLTVLVLKRCK